MTIGSNVFIGMNAIIMRGVTIGDNVIIGAGSVVTSDCESNYVYAGSPARKIMTMTEYLRKRDARQFAEAKEMALIYQQRFGKHPPKEIFREYFMLFSTASEAEQVPEFRSQMALCDGFQESEAYMNTHKPMFEDYEAFMGACFGYEVTPE